MRHSYIKFRDSFFQSVMAVVGLQFVREGEGCRGAGNAGRGALPTAGKREGISF